MRIGIFRKPIIAGSLEAQHGSGSENPNKRYPLEGRQGPSDSASQEPQPTPTEEPTPTPTPTNTTTRSSSTSSSPTSTSESSSSRPSSTPPPSTPGRPTSTEGPTLTAQPSDSSTPGLTRSTITYTQLYTNTADPSGTPGANNNGGGGGGFWNNKAAVGAVFGIVGAAGLVIIFILITNAIRRAQVRKYDRELIEAASANPRSPGAYRDNDDEQPTLPFQSKEESYDMHEFNGQGQYGHPYSAAGAAGVGAAGGYHNYYNQNDYNQQHYSQGYQYTDGSTSHHSSGAAAGYYHDPRQDPRHASFPGPAGYQQNRSPPPRGHPYASPPPGTYPPTDGYADGYNHPADGYDHPQSSAYVAPEPSAYGGIEPGYAPDPMPPAAAAAYGERGAYAHMQRQDQLNRALSQRSTAPTYQTHQGSSGQDHGQRGLAGIVAAAGLGPHGSSSEKAPLPPPPPPPPPPAEPSHPAPPRTSEEHGNKSEGELPNPFRRRASGETVSAEDWDDDESTGHGGGRVLKVANL